MNLVLNLSGKFKSLVKMVKIDKNTKIVVLLGGNSSEREISISSGEECYQISDIKRFKYNTF